MQWLFVTIQCNIDHNRKKKRNVKSGNYIMSRKISYYEQARTPHWQKRLDNTVDLTRLIECSREREREREKIVLSTWINNGDEDNIIKILYSKQNHDSSLAFFLASIFHMNGNELSEQDEGYTYSSLSYISFLFRFFSFFLIVCLMITQK